MKKHMAMKLVKALRSGEYEQGRTQLVDEDDRFCCLGVACNINEVELDWKYNKSWKRWEMDGDSGVLPYEVQKEFGFDTEQGHRRDGRMIRIGGISYKNLADANDRGVPFTDIADYIEANYKEL